VAAMTIDAAAGRYWSEVGQGHACASETFVNLERLVGYFGKDKLLAEITDDDVAKMVAWRRSHHRWGRKDFSLIAPATVNRSTTEVLQKLFTRAREYWNARFENEPKWRKHMLREPEERVRELSEGEAEALEMAIRSDYAPFFAFVHASGQRAFKECLLEWSEVNWSTRHIIKKGKQDRTITIPITDEIAAIIAPLIGHHERWVFTYVAQRTRRREDLVKGRRYPITKSGAKTQWQRDRLRAGISDFRIHDFRHDLGTKVLRKTGNLKLVQRALNHADIKTTTRYAHVLDHEVAAALESVQADQKSRDKSRDGLTKAS
jgi:integrase